MFVIIRMGHFEDLKKYTVECGATAKQFCMFVTIRMSHFEDLKNYIVECGAIAKNTLVLKRGVYIRKF